MNSLADDIHESLLRQYPFVVMVTNRNLDYLIDHFGDLAEIDIYLNDGTLLDKWRGNGKWTYRFQTIYFKYEEDALMCKLAFS